MTFPLTGLCARFAALIPLAILTFLPPAASAQTINRPPTISGVPPTSVQPGRLYSFRPSGSDPEGRRLTFHIANRPGWASFDRATGRLWGTPAAKHVGRYANIRIAVSDGVSSRALPLFTITVGSAPSSTANTAPTISGSPPASGRVGQAYYFRPTASDREGNPLTFAIANRPSWATFNSTNGTLSGTPGSGTAGTYPNITIRVSDGRVTTSLPAFAITVQPPATSGGGTGNAALAWVPPTRRTDGTLLTNLAGFRIRYGTSASNQPNVIRIGSAAIRSAVVTELAPATYYFSVSAFDAAGVASAYTAPVTITIR